MALVPVRGGLRFRRGCVPPDLHSEIPVGRPRAEAHSPLRDGDLPVGVG